MNIKRYSILDGIRGFSVVSMILYHAAWDLVYLFSFDWPWYRSEFAYFWQQSICWTFIFLSGFCQPLGRKKWSRGLSVFFFGFLITVVTTILMPENRILFGVLTLIGSCMLLMIPLEPILKSCNPTVGFFGSFALFILTRNVNQGALGFGTWNICALPDSWYHNLLTTYLGFPMQGFYSTDYFSLIPWIFLFVSGYFLHQYCVQKNLLHYFQSSKIKPFERIGQHALEIYLVHQPALYLLFTVLFFLQERSILLSL